MNVIKTYQFNNQVELEELNQLIEACMLDIQSAPEGKLRISRSGTTTQYYCRTNTKDVNGKYMSKKEPDIIRALVQKEYANEVIKLANNQKKLVERIISENNWSRIEGLYPEYAIARKKYIKPYVLQDDEYVKYWEEQKKIQRKGYLNYIQSGRCSEYDMRKYQSMQIKEDEGILTDRGELVRSKSEKIIADKLYHLGIPYVYEQPLYLESYGYVFPDFMMLNVRGRKEYLGEHLGMMDDIEYCEHAMKKIETYAKNDIHMGVDLLTTYESKTHPLSTQMLDKMVKRFLI